MRLAILAFVAGVGWLQMQADLPSLPWAALLLLTPVLFLLSKRVQRGLWLIVAFAAGFYWAATVASYRLSDQLPAAWEGRDIQLMGVVAELPQRTERGLRFVFDVEKVATSEARVPKRIQLFWFARAQQEDEGAHLNPAHLRAGERWQFVVRLKKPHGSANPHGFDYEAWLLERNIRATGYVRQDPNNFRLHQFVWHPAYMIERLRDATAQRMRQVLWDQEYGGVLTALAIGDQHAITQTQWRTFFRSGVSHLMSISGLHVTLFSSLIFLIAQSIWRRSPSLTQRLPARKAGLVFGAFAALNYALLTGFAIPAQRTLYMLMIVALAVWFDRFASASRVLSLALLVVVVLDPWAVLAPGFWLSFGAVALIFFISSQRIGQPPAWKQALHVQGAVTVGLIPAMLILFQQVSVVSPIANAIAIPLVSYLIVPLTLAGAFLPLDFLLQAAHAAMAVLMPLLTGLAEAPHALWQQYAPPLWSIGFGLLGVAWLLAPRGMPARWVGGVLLLPLFLLPPPGLPLGTLHLTVLDVGQGLAVVAKTQHHALVFDTGARFTQDSDAGARTVLPYLRASGVRALQGLIVSHSDNDHAGGAQSLLDGIPVQWLLSSLPEGHALQANAARKLRCAAGQRWQWDGVQFEILHPHPVNYLEKRKPNDQSCVLRIVAGPHRVLIPSDIEARSERELLARDPEKLRAEVLIVPHHGSRTSSTEAFVQAVQPKVAIFTVGYRNRFRHPRPDVVSRYAAVPAQLWQTDRDGAIDLILNPTQALSIASYRKKTPRYWRGA